MTAPTSLNPSTSAMKVRRVTVAGIPLPAIAMLLLTAAISVLWSHQKMIGNGEFFSVDR